MAHVARKRFGQHFLTATDVIDRIIRAIDPQPGERLVEIGPGLGAMTLPLVAAPRGGARIGSDVILASLVLVGPAAGWDVVSD